VNDQLAQTLDTEKSNRGTAQKQSKTRDYRGPFGGGAPKERGGGRGGGGNPSAWELKEEGRLREDRVAL